MKLGITGALDFYNYEYVEGWIKGMLPETRPFYYFDTKNKKRRGYFRDIECVVTTNTTGVAYLAMEFAKNHKLPVEIASDKEIVDQSDILYIVTDYDDKEAYGHQLIEEYFKRGRNSYKVWIDSISRKEEPIW